MGQTLEGTVALVTGASSGIGEATARALAERGAKVAVAARRKDRLDALAGEIDGLAIEADVTQREQATAAVETTVSELGRLDIVINNAGVMLLGTIADAPVEEWDRMFDLNVKGLMYVAHAALPHLIQAADGDPRRVADLVNVSSVAGRRVGVGGGVYQATKHAVGVFSEALRQEVTERHVRVAPDGAGRGRDRAHPSHAPGDPRRAQLGRPRQRDPPGRGHRGRDRLHGHAPAAHGHQRDADPPDRAGQVGRPSTASTRLP